MIIQSESKKARFDIFLEINESSWTLIRYSRVEKALEIKPLWLK